MPRLLAIKQVIYELGISRTALYELINAGKLKTVKIGRRRLVPIEAIEELVAGLGQSVGGHDAQHHDRWCDPTQSSRPRADSVDGNALLHRR
jgi:excisionase family DNA binding protein